MAKHKKLRWINRLIGLALAVFAVWALWHFPWADTGRAIEHASVWPLLLAIVVNLAGLVARGWAWSLLLKPAAPHRLKIALEATLLGAAVASVSIAVAGEGSRVRFIARRDDVPPKLALAAIVWSRVIEGVALVGVLVVVPPLLHIPGQVRWLSLGAAVVVLIGAALLALRRRFSLSRHLPRFTRKAVETMKRIPLGGRRLTGPLLLSFAHWITQWATYHLAFVATGVSVPIAASFAAVVVANLAWVFRFTPGNIGVMQGSIALAMLPFGVPSGTAVVAGVLLQALQVIPTTALAATLIGVRGLGKLVREEEEAEQELDRDDDASGVSQDVGRGGGG